MSDNLILVHVESGIGYLTLNNPKMNAFSKPLVEALIPALESMWFNPSVRVVALRGAGGNFSAGGDIQAMKARIERTRQGLPPDPDPRENLRRLNRLVSLVRAIDKPVVAWIEGAIAGGGLGLAMACDFSLAQEDSKFSFAFSGIGLAADMGATASLSARVGAPRATELLMLGSRFTGRQAAEWGVITRACPAGALEEEVGTLLGRLAAGPTLSYATTKAYINRAYYGDLDPSMSVEVEQQASLSRSQDHAEAIEAFLEKRPAVFQGK